MTSRADMLRRVEHRRAERAALSIGGGCRPGTGYASSSPPVEPVHHRPVAQRSRNLQGRWGLADLIAGDDRQFLLSAHEVLLGRVPSRPQEERRLNELAMGMSRYELIARLALSPEGRRYHAKIRGVAFILLRLGQRGMTAAEALGLQPAQWLRRSSGEDVAGGSASSVHRVLRDLRADLGFIYYALSSIPIVGYLLRICIGIVRLPKIHRELHHLRSELQRLKDPQRN